MPKAFATLVTEISQELQDSGNTVWEAAELGIQLEDAIGEVSEYDPYVVLEVFEFENRSGTDTAGTAGSLTDTTNLQFRSTDVGKVIFNTTDRTWAIVTTYTSTSVLVLSKDIMDTGESYVVYNQGCRNVKQIYVGDVVDYVGSDHGVVSVEYPFGSTMRNFSVEGDILQVDIDSDPPSSKNTNAQVEVGVWFRKRHFVSQLTDLDGAVDLTAGYAAGLQTIHVDGLAATEVIAADQEFTVAGLRGTYKLTAATTLASNEGDITFWPPLESAIEDGDAVTFKGSTLSRKLERMVVELAAGRAAYSKAATVMVQANAAITSAASAATALALMTAKVLRQVTDAGSARTASALLDEIILEANTEIDKIAAEVALANTALDSGNALINTVTVGAGVPGNYAAEAAQRINTGKGYLETARGYLEQVRGGAENTRVLIELGASELAGAQGSFNQAVGYIQKATVELAAVDRGAEFRYWGRDKANWVLAQLERSLKPKVKRAYSKV